MLKLHKLIAAVGGIGYIGKGGGTVAAIVVCVAWYLFFSANSFFVLQVVSTLIILLVGTWSADAVHDTWGKDSSKVVIDEVAGMMITLLFVPVEIKYVLTGLILFRFFDIAKPLFIRRMENLPKGWGVMADDVLAGIYSNIILLLIIKFNLF